MKAGVVIRCSQITRDNLVSMLRAFTRNDTFSNAYEYLIGDYALVIIVLIMLWLRFWPNFYIYSISMTRVHF